MWSRIGFGEECLGEERPVDMHMAAFLFEMSGKEMMMKGRRCL